MDYFIVILFLEIVFWIQISIFHVEILSCASRILHISKEMVSEIAMKWTKVARTGATEARFSTVDLSTLMFTMPKGLNVLELKEYLLSQPEAYEIKIGDQLFRRPGDPTFDEVFRKLQMDKAETSDDTANDEL
ncbi:hypothetical protein SASPL_105946 [Salvia splendens]|uniref:Uncharacterized protein n=1 Tax=Salvia splendens TaxID=180675 RepID=A0A8X9AB91_SALSN|nr:hypothetical protein SASPL_105946 [Salvia splendens]